MNSRLYNLKYYNRQMCRFLFFILFIAFTSYSQQSKNVPNSSGQNSEVEIQAPTMNNSNAVMEEIRIESSKKLKSRSASDSFDGDKYENVNLQQQISSNYASFSSYLNQSQWMSERKTPTSEQLKYMENYLNNLREIGPNSYERNIAEFQFSKYSSDKFIYLQKAERHNMDNKEVQKLMVSHYEIIDDQRKKSEYLKKLYDSKYFSDDLSYYAELVLKSVDDNALLITHGIEDTYPIWMKQQINKIGTNIHVLSLDLIHDDNYREKFISLGYVFPNRSIIDSDYLTEFKSLNSGKKLNFSMSIPGNYFKNIVDDLLIEGVTFTNMSSNNVQLNNSFYNYLKGNKKFTSPNTAKGEKLQLNLIPMLFLLHEKDTKISSNELEQLMFTITKRLGRDRELKNLLSK